MDRITVIANPAASQFTGGSHRDVMATLDRVSKVEAVWPGSAAEAADRSREAARSGADIVVAMGGDGMVHHVAQGLVGTDTVLGIIPVGTTNVIARLMGMPEKPVKAARLLASGVDPTHFGVAVMNLTRGKTETTHHAIFACGFGLDATVVAKADKEPYRKYRFGSVHYLTTALGVALTDFPGRSPHLDITSSDWESRSAALLLQFRPVYTYFGRVPLRLAPEEPDPMIALTIEGLPRHRIPQVAATVFAGRDLGTVPGLDTWKGVERVAVEADPPVAAQADGESLGIVDGGVVSWQPDSLWVVASQSPR